MSVYVAGDLPFFGAGNAKLPDTTLTFGLPAGHSCPGAKECLLKTARESGKPFIVGPDTQFMCHEALIEAYRSKMREQRWVNLDLLRNQTAAAMSRLLSAGIDRRRHLTPYAERVRWFVSGDCFNSALLRALLQTSKDHDDLVHYFYSKNIPLFIGRGAVLPENLRVTFSWGGRFDHLIAASSYPRTARVVTSTKQLEDCLAKGMKQDTTDRLAWQKKPEHFFHLVHGNPNRQPLAVRNAIKEFKAMGLHVGYPKR